MFAFVSLALALYFPYGSVCILISILIIYNLFYLIIRPYCYWIQDLIKIFQETLFIVLLFFFK
jgi:hypothetical protein